MPTTVSIPTSGVSFILNGTVIDNFIDGDTIKLTLINSLTERLNGANGSVTITQRVDGTVADVVFKIVRYSNNDVLLSAAWNKQPVEIFDGSLKEDYYADGENAKENWTLENGTFTTPPVHAKNTQEGQFTVEYTMQFRNARRVI